MSPFKRSTPDRSANPYGQSEKKSPSSGKSALECQANGCPLPGTYRINAEASLCCVHDGEDAHMWAEQTERILGNLHLWWIALDMSNSDPGEPIKQSTINDVAAEGGPDDSDVATRRAYAQKIRAFLLKRCKGERKPPAAMSPFRGLVERLTHPTKEGA